LKHSLTGALRHSKEYSIKAASVYGSSLRGTWSEGHFTGNYNIQVVSVPRDGLGN